MEQALYRRYRPQKWNDVLGQEHVVRVLRGALKEGNVAHAYLFAGSRGTGKTSVARILARELGTSENDLYEIDAASHTGVDDIREIREAVLGLPFDSRYKVYVLDEVHMLSKSAFNALLKVLEEPPSHVLFVLATTEMEKLPDTVVSRCEVHQFKKPSRAVLKKHLIDVAGQEGFVLEPAAGELITLLSEGSFRDAQGTLQKVFSSSRDKKVSVEEVEMATGAPRGELVNDIVKALDSGETARGLAAITKAVDANVDMNVLAKLLLEKLRAVLLLRFAARAGREMVEEEFTDEDVALLKKMADNESSHIGVETLQEFLAASTAVSRTSVSQLPLELAIIKSQAEKDI